jgi:hypothetical protein
MVVRGYNGKMAEATIGTIGLNDWLPVGAGIALLTTVILWR